MNNLVLANKNIKNKENLKNYDCIICFQMCKKPISCIRCHQLICYHHIRLLGNKCPHCRLQPFQFKKEQMIQSFIDIQIRKQREQMKKQNVFKCLVQGCQFQGKYPKMVFHKKSKHSNQSIDEIIFPEERQKKKMRQALKRIFLIKYIEKAQQYKQQALRDYVRFGGRVQLKHLIKLIAHKDNCQNHNCKRILLIDNAVFLGQMYDGQVQQSDCLQAINLRVQL